MRWHEQAVAYRIRCFVHPFQDLYYLSHLYSGLCALAKVGIARIDFEQPRPEATYALDPVVLWTEVANSRSGKHCKIVYDMYDRSDLFVMDSLDLCDKYFKRSYHPPDLRQLSPKLRAKVIPFGLIHPCGTPESTLRLVGSLLPSWTLKMLRSPVETLRKLRTASFKPFLTNPQVSAFEQSPDCPVDRSVHFESRVWEQRHLGPDSEEEVNQPRVQLSRLLKKEFGASFHGGIVHTNYARQYCPGELSRDTKVRRRYVARSKRMMIGVYTRGLHHSIAFKLAEYLASSKCIVSQPLRNQLPTPLLAGRNYLEFSTPQQCVERCIQILNDDDLAHQMRRDNWDYYQREVRPDSHLANCLERAFQEAVEPVRLAVQ
jgi:hypothetical protein